MFAAVLMVAQVTAGQPVATCRVPNDPQERSWSLEQVSPEAWRVVFSAKSLDRPRVELPLPNPQVSVSPTMVVVLYRSANGGRAIEWSIGGNAGKLDLRVNHGLEVNVERDLDPAVDLMNTDGDLSVACVIAPPPKGLPDEAGDTSSDGRRAPLYGVPEARAGEWMLGAGVARSVNLFESTSGRAYAVQTIAWARELTGDLNIIGIRGRFAWGVEAMPVFAQFDPARIYGAGFAPVVWRWNFPPAPTWSAYGELAMGGMFASDAIPEGTSRANFTAHWGGGVRLRPRGRHALLLAYRFQHFSNGNQLGSNPGVNSHVFVLGWSHRS